MSAKKAKRHHPAPAATTPMTTAGPVTDAGPTAENVSWMDSPDPKKRQMGKFVLIGLWVYVAALWLLALDQWFNWGIFGPKTPPLP